MQKAIKNVTHAMVWLLYITTTVGLEHAPGPYIKCGIGKELFAERFVKRSNEIYENASPKGKAYYEVGVGYKLNRNLQIDINGQQRSLHYSAKTSDTILSQNIESYSAFISLYYIIPTDTGFSAYLTAAAGCAYNKPDPLAIKFATNPRLFLAQGQITANFAYNIGAGVTIQLSDLHPNLDLVLSYRYVDLGGFKIDRALDYNPSEQSLKVHEIGAGFIFNL